MGSDMPLGCFGSTLFFALECTTQPYGKQHVSQKHEYNHWQDHQVAGTQGLAHTDVTERQARVGHSRHAIEYPEPSRTDGRLVL